jgi:hypothetical protein
MQTMDLLHAADLSTLRTTADQKAVCKKGRQANDISSNAIARDADGGIPRSIGR